MRVNLPGDLYEQAGQWWWRTTLPGEDKAKARPLKAPGTAEAARDRDSAEKIALEIWEQAAAQHGARQLTLDCTQKVERLKAQFLDKVRQLTEIVESANAKAQAEAKARAEIEAKLNAVIQAGEHAGCVEHTDGPKATGDVRPTKSDAGIERPMRNETVETVRTTRPTPSSLVTENHNPVPRTGICECCGAPDVLVSDLEAIDSGQLLCPDCLAALHIDISRIEARAFSNSRA